ncbi:DUF1127 domain-containing protein [Sulfitobacter aestuarii]|uniref:DUF1127 domain-containing protein n=1 Tax=Sulfitobacter aestuarii TaxID=2161676 RepID=A0ABW5U0N2_9RHOB
MARAFTASTDLSLSNRRSLPVAARLAVRFAGIASLWTTRHRSRRALGKLEPWQLEDVGLTPGQAVRESARVFWKA